MKTIEWKTSEENWKLQDKLKARGYVKTSDCYWYQTFEKGNKVISLHKV